MKKSYHVYIISNISKMLYVGVTNNLEHRVFQHKAKLIDGFTKKYNLHRLVYFEVFGDIRDAIAREKQIKGWLRSKKVALIESANPDWRDLSADWMKKLPPPSKVSGSQRHEWGTAHGGGGEDVVIEMLRCAQHDSSWVGW